MTKVIKSLLRFAVASAVLAGLSQAAHAAAVPSSANVADSAVNRANNTVNTVISSDSAEQKNSHTTVSTSSNTNSTNPPTAADILDKTAAAGKDGTSLSSVTGQDAKQTADSDTKAIASSSSDLKTHRTANDSQTNLSQNQTNVAEKNADPIVPSASSTAAPPKTVSNELAQFKPAPRLARASLDVSAQTPLANPAPASQSNNPVNDNAPFNPLTAGSLILNLAQSATLVSYQHIVTDFTALLGPWQPQLPLRSVSVIVALISLALLAFYAGIVALWRRSGFARAPRSANTSNFQLAIPESLRVLSLSSLFSSQHYNPSGVNQ